MMRKGDKVLIECDGEKFLGTVLLASGNNVSLMLGFEAVIDGHVGMMPVMKSDDGLADHYYSIITGIGVKVRKWEGPAG